MVDIKFPNAFLKYHKKLKQLTNYGRLRQIKRRKLSCYMTFSNPSIEPYNHLESVSCVIVSDTDTMRTCVGPWGHSLDSLFH